MSNPIFRRRFAAATLACAMLLQLATPAAGALTVGDAVISIQTENPSLPSGVPNPKGNIGFILANIFWKSGEPGYNLTKFGKINPKYVDGLGIWTETSSGTYLTSGGNVGIGTSSPSAKLHVAGMISASGAQIGWGSYGSDWPRVAVGDAQYGMSSLGGALYLHEAGAGIRVVRNGVQQGMVLHSGNFNAYAPTLTGGGASGTWGINVTGNAGTATKLQTARTVSMTGDGSWSVSFDGSGNATAGMTIANSAVTSAKIADGAVSTADIADSAVTDAKVASGISPSKLAAGTAGISITGNAATASSVPWSGVTGKPTTVSGYGITDFVSRNSATPTAPDSATTNGLYYANSVSLFGQTDGALYAQAYSSSWVAQIFQDYRTGQLALRGKNNGTWQGWRTVLDSSNAPYAASMNQFVRSSDSPTFAGMTMSQNARIRYSPNGNWGGELYVGGNGREGLVDTPAASVVTTNGTLHLDSGSGADAYLNYYDGNAVYIGRGNNSVRAAFNNTGLWLYDGWLRTHGSNGWFSQDYGGGWHMTDTTWIRAYNSKSVYTPGEMQAGTVRANTSLCIGSDCRTSWSGFVTKSGISASAPLTYDSATGVFGIAKSSSSADGYLSSSDWNLFNGKANANGSNASGTWGINVTGNAGTATKLQTARTVSMTGDGSWSVSFDGSGNATAGMTIANSAVTSAKIADGAVSTADIADSAVTDAKVASGISPSKLAAGTAGISITGNAATATRISGYSLPETGSSAGWVYLGRWTGAPQQGAKALIRIIASNGYNASSTQDQMTEAFFKTSNGTSSAAGSAGPFYGNGTAYVSGGNSSAPSVVRVVQDDSSNFDFYGNFGNFTGRSHYEVSINAGSWTHAGTLANPSGNHVDLTVTRTVNSGNYADYAPTLTGTGASGTWGINVTGNAGTATKLQTARTVSMTGDGSWSVSFDGSGNATAGMTIANSAVTSAKIADGAVSTADIADSAVTDAKVASGISPSKLAAGTAGISITGNAATATSSPLLSALANYVWSASTLPTGFNQGVQASFVSAAQGYPSYGSLLNVNTYSGGGGALQMYVPYSPTHGGTGLQVRFGNYDVSSGNSWTSWKTLLASDNFNAYAPTLTGGGASGTWGINVTGNAGTATKLQTARTVNGTSFDGSANVTTANWGTARTLWGRSVNGSADVSAPLLPAAGSVTAPAYSVAGDTDTGIWFPAADQVSIGVAGTTMVSVRSSGVHSNSWLRTYGTNGWYSQDYGGGWHMTDTTWIRAYNSKSVYTPGEMQAGTVRANTSLCIGSDCRTSWADTSSYSGIRSATMIRDGQFTVPPGITTLSVRLLGGGGGGGGYQGGGGGGATCVKRGSTVLLRANGGTGGELKIGSSGAITATGISVTPGETLSIFIGAGGGGGADISAMYYKYSGGGGGGFGGGGGGSWYGAGGGGGYGGGYGGGPNYGGAGGTACGTSGTAGAGTFPGQGGTATQGGAGGTQGGGGGGGWGTAPSGASESGSELAGGNGILTMTHSLLSGGVAMNATGGKYSSFDDGMNGTWGVGGGGDGGMAYISW